MIIFLIRTNQNKHAQFRFEVKINAALEIVRVHCITSSIMTWIKLSFLLVFSSLTAFYKLSIGIEFARNETHSLCQSSYVNDNFGFLGLNGNADDKFKGTSNKPTTSGWVKRSVNELRSTMVPELGGILIYDFPATRVTGDTMVPINAVKTQIVLHEFGSARLETSMQKLLVSMPMTKAVTRMTMIRSTSYVAIYLDGVKVGQMGLAENELVVRMVPLNGPKRIRTIEGFVSALVVEFEGQLLISHDIGYSSDVCLNIWLAPELDQLTIEQGDRRLIAHATEGWQVFRLPGNETIAVHGTIPADTEEGYEVAVVLTENLVCHDGPLVVTGAATGCADEHSTAYMSKTRVDVKFDLDCDGDCLLCNENGCKCSGSLSLDYECVKPEGGGKFAGFSSIWIYFLAAVAAAGFVLILTLVVCMVCRKRPNPDGYSRMEVGPTVTIAEFFNRVQEDNAGEQQDNILLHPITSTMVTVNLTAPERSVNPVGTPLPMRANVTKVKESAGKDVNRKEPKTVERERKIAAANKILQKCKRIARTAMVAGEKV